MSFGRLHALILLQLVLGIPSALAPRLAQAQSPASEQALTEGDSVETAETVKELMRIGSAEFQQGNVEAAREAFQKAWDLNHHPAIAASLADAEMRLERYRDAAAHLAYYLENLPAELSHKRVDAEAKLAECRAHLGRVNIVVNVNGATVLIDGKVVGVAPLDAELWLEPGTHRVEATHQGLSAAPRRISVATGSAQTMTLDLRQGGSEPRTSVPATDRRNADRALVQAEPGTKGRALALIGGSVVTAVALGVGLGFHMKSMALESEADDLREQAEREGDPRLLETNMVCSPPPGARPDICGPLKEKRQEQDDALIVAVIAYGGAGVAAAATLVTFLAWPSKTPPASKKAAVAWAPWSLRGAHGVQAEVHF